MDMLFERLYKPSGSEILYHYCSAETFLSICTRKRLRFSDIFSMNDFLEMHWGYQVWERAAGKLLDTVGKEFLDEIDKLLHMSSFLGLPVASCFSLDGDVLSQWRAYATDGKGYAIGFRADQMSLLPARPLEVLYDHGKQINEVERIVRAIHEVEANQTIKGGSDFRQACLLLAFDLAAFKNSAFIEEKEIRLLHLLNFEKSHSSMRLIDAGGTAFGASIAGESVSFLMRESVPVPYIDLDFTDGGKINPIHDVVVGPKNHARLSAVSVFLETSGLTSVTVRKSAASYR